MERNIPWHQREHGKLCAVDPVVRYDLQRTGFSRYCGR